MVLLALALLTSLQEGTTDSRLGVPSRDEQRKAERLVKDLFKKEFRAKDPAQLRAFARTLLDQAVKDSQEDGVRYVLFENAKTIAMKAGDFSAALSAVDGLVDIFAVDPIDTKRDALSDILRYRPNAGQITDIARGYMLLAEKALSANRYGDALDLLKDAGKLARSTRQTALAARAAARSKEVSGRKSTHERFLKAMRKLEKNPTDERAHLEVGQHLCFVANDWPRGLKHLVKGGGEYARLARMELLGTLTLRAKNGLGEAWWSHSKRERDKSLKTGCQNRAHHWVLAALEEAEGIAELTIKKRLREIEKEMGGSAPVDLLALIDPKRDSVEDEWSFEGAALVSPVTAHGRIEVPFAPPSEYDLTIVATNKTDRGALMVGLSVDGKQFHVGVDILDGFSSTMLGMLKGQQNPVSRTNVYSPNAEKEVVCSVRQAKVTVKVDGKVILEWEADYDAVSPQQNWTSPTKNALFLGNHFGDFRITQYTLQPVSGPGKRLK